MTYEIIKHIHCKTALEFYNIISPHGAILKNIPSHYDWIFRGHGNDKFKLLASALRPGLRDYVLRLSRAAPDVRNNIEKIISQVRVEIDILLDFLRYADLSGLSIPNDSSTWRENINEFHHNIRNACIAPHLLSGALDNLSWPLPEIIPLMALARHYSIPTRLLDWTYSSLIAAYFAAEDAVKIESTEENGMLSLWALHRLNLLIARDYPIRRSINLPIGIAVAPGATNQNMNAQRGLFTYEYYEFIREDSLEIYRPLDEIVMGRIMKAPLEEIAPMMYHVTCSRKEAGKLLWLLDKDGVNASQLFPGYVGVARYMEIKTLHEYPYSEERV